MKLKGFDAYMEPCPFCGNDNLSARFSCEVTMVELRVKCNKCGAEITFAPNVSEIWVENMIVDRRPEYDPLEHWNARQPEATDKVSFGDKDHVWIAGKQYISLLRFQEKVKEVQPKEGYWIEGGIYRDVIECHCSECGQLMTTAATVRMNYCPNCGARMVKGERQK